MYMSEEICSLLLQGLPGDVLRGLPLPFLLVSFRQLGPSTTSTGRQTWRTSWRVAVPRTTSWKIGAMSSNAEPWEIFTRHGRPVGTELVEDQFPLHIQRLEASL